MADPFEVRLKFTRQLQHLTANVNQSAKVTMFALKHRDMAEDLHSCILEVLESAVKAYRPLTDAQASLNVRANILYFIDQLCDSARHEHCPEFADMIGRDAARIADAVAPADGSGAPNVKVAKLVFSRLHRQSVISADVLRELQDSLADRAIAPGHPALAQHGAEHSQPPGEPTIARPEKRHVEQRLEEDRERHKRVRESLWTVGARGGKSELDDMWETVSDLGEDDYLAAQEDAEERQRALANAGLAGLAA